MSSNNQSSSKVVTPVAAPVASISGGAQTVKEGGVLSFNINIAKASSTETRVYFKLSGSEEGYKLPSNVVKDGDSYYVIIPKGQTSSKISINLKDDNVFDGSDTLAVTLVAKNNVTVDANKSVLNTTILDNDAPPKISMDVSKSVEEGGKLTYTIKLDRASSEDTIVKYTVNGEPKQLTIKAGDTKATFEVNSQANDVFNGTQKVVAVITSATTNGVDLALLQKDSDHGEGDDEHSDDDHSGNGNGLVAVGKILDNGDKPVVTIDVSAPVEEGGDLIYTVKLSKASSQETVIKYVISGTATAGDDFSAPEVREVRIAAGQTSADIKVTSKIDGATEGAETVTVTLTSAVTNGVQLIDGDDHEEEDHEDDEYSYSAESKDGDDHESDDENCSNDDDHDVAGVSATGTILDKAINTAPVDGDETNTVTEDTTLTVTAADGLLKNAADVEGDDMTVTGYTIDGVTGDQTVGSPVVIDGVGTITINANGSYSFAPAKDYAGSIPVITYTVSDGTLTDTSTLTLSMSPVNDAPVDGDETNTVTEDTTLTVTAADGLLKNAADVEGDDMTVTGYTIDGVTGDQTVGSPVVIDGVGTITINANGSYSFAPAKDYAGSIPVITYTVSDGTLTDTSTLTLSMSPVNDAPVDGDETNTVTEDTTLTVTAADGLLKNAADVEGDDMTVTGYTIDGVTGDQTVGSPVVIDGVGTITINANGSYSFAPAKDYAGSIPVITYTVSDGTLTDTSTLTLSMSPVNDAPVDGDETNTVTEDTTLTVTAADGLLKNAADVEGDDMTVTGYTIDGVTGDQTVGSPVVIDGVGTITINANGSYSFAPAKDYAGSIPVITYTVSDGTLTDTSTLTLSMSPVNDAPVDGDETNTVTEDTTLTVTAADGLLKNAADVEGDDMTVTGYTIDGVTGDQTVGSPVVIDGVGTITINANGSYSFAPAKDYAGSIPVITYTVSDGTLTDTSTLTLSMSPVNDAPVDGDETNTVTEDTTLTVTAADGLLKNAADVEGDDMTVTGYTIDGVTGDQTVGSPVVIDGVGTITINANGSYSFAPAKDYAGSIPVITYTVSDGTLTDTSTLTLSMSPVNDAPVDGDETNTVTEDTTLTVTAADGLLKNAADVEGDDMTVTGYTIDGVTGDQTVGSPVVIDGVGTITINANGSYSFAPAKDYAGSIPVITYTVSDGTLTDTSTLTLSMSPVNDAPVDGDETNTVTEDTTLTVTAADGLLKNAADVEGDDMTVTGYTIDGVTGDQTVGSPVVIDGVGTITINANGSYSFAPAKDYAGSIPVITYTVSDGTLTDTSTLTLSMSPVNDAPVDGDETNTVTEDTTLTVTAADGLLKNAADVEGDDMTVTGYTIDGVTGDQTVGSPVVIDGVGTITINANGSYSFAPAKDYAGSIPVITYTVSDGTLTDTSTLTLSMSPVNDAPVAVNDINSTVGLTATEPSVNMMLVIDVSGSMTTNVTYAGQTISRMEATKLALNDLLDTYDANTNAMVRLVKFSGKVDTTDTGDAVQLGDTWLTIAAARTFIDALTAGPSDTGQYTNYDAAIAVAKSAFATSAGKLTDSDVRNVSYFISDGDPTLGSVSGTVTLLSNPTQSGPQSTGLGLDATEEASWKSFLNTNKMTSYAFGVGSGATQVNLDPVAWDGFNASNLNGVVVQNEAELPTFLNSTLVTTAHTVATGTVLTNDQDPLGGSLTVSAIRTGDEAGSGTAGTLGNALVGLYGSLIIKSDGTYSYTVDPTKAALIAHGKTADDIFTYTVTNADGSDKAELKVTVPGDPNLTPTITSSAVVNGESITFTASDIDSTMTYAAPFDYVTSAINEKTPSTFTATEQGTLKEGNLSVTDGEFTEKTGIYVALGTSAAETIGNTGNGTSALYGFGGDDTINGGSGVDNIFGGTGNDTIKDNLVAETAAQSQISTLTFNANGYDAGDVVKVTVDGVDYSHTVVTGSTTAEIVYDALKAVSVNGVTLANSLSGKGVTWAGNLSSNAVTLTSTAGAANSFTIAAGIANAANSWTTTIDYGTPGSFTANTGTISITFNGVTYTSATSNAANSNARFDAVAPGLRDQLNAVAGVTATYDAANDLFTIVSNFDPGTVTSSATGQTTPAIATTNLGVQTQQIPSVATTQTATDSAIANDVMSGGDGDDTITSTGGTDTLNGDAGADIFNLGTSLTSGDTINGGADSDTLNFTDAGGATTDLDNVTNVERIVLGNAATSVTTVNGLVASGATLTVDGSALTSAMTWNGAAETDGQFVITSGTGNDTITGGSGADTITSGSGTDTLNGGAGADIFNLAGNLTSGDSINGGADSDTLNFTDAGGATNDLNAVTNVERIVLGNAATSVTTVNGLVASGATLTVDGSALTSAMTWNGAAETDGQFVITSGTGNDTITGGSGADTITGGAGTDSITGGAGADTMTGGAGTDTFVFASGASTLTFGGSGTSGTISGYDVITDFNSSSTYDILDVVSTAALATTTGATNGTNSTLQLNTNATASSHAINASGRVTFDDANTFTTAITLGSWSDVAAATQYLNANSIGAVAGATVFFNATIGSVAHTFIYTQTTGGTAGGQLIDLSEVTLTSLSTTSTTGGVIGRVTPISLDMNQDGIISYLSLDAGVQFDYNQDGVAERTAWTGPEDGLLALLREDGSLQIAFSTQEGETDLQAIAKLFDSNQDNILDIQDEAFANFGVWVDANSDGTAQEGEFQSLAAAQIQSLNLVSDGNLQTMANGDVNSFGNTLFTMENGAQQVAQDVSFAVAEPNHVALVGISQEPLPVDVPLV